MKLQCFVLLCLTVAVHSAHIRQREIPVHVIYYGDDLRMGVAVPRQRVPQEEIQAAEFMKLPEQCDPEVAQSEETTSRDYITASSAEIIAEDSQRIEEEAIQDNQLIGIKNLDAKNQLSPEQQSESIKHLPVITTHISESSVPSNDAIRSDIPSEVIKIEEATQRPQGYLSSIVDQAQQIAAMGIKMLKDRYLDMKQYTGAYISEDDWNNLEKSVDELFSSEKEKVDLKQENQNQTQNQNNIIQNIVSNFQNLTNNFIQNLQQRPSGANGTQSEEQQPGFGQGIFNYFSQAFQQVVNNINNLNQNNGTSAASAGNGTAQADTGANTTQRPGIISNFVSSVQQFFGNQGNQQQVSNNQSDPGTATSQGPGGFFQGAINNFNQAVNNFIPGNRPTAAPGSQGDTTGETTTNRNPIQAFQNFGNQVISNINQFNPFTTSTKPPGSAGDEGQATTQRPGIVQVIQGFNPFRPQQPSGGNEQATSPNPIVAGIQNVGNQFQQVVGNQSFGNPIESIQNAVNGSNPIESIQNAVSGGLGGSNPIQQGIQNAQNAISGGTSESSREEYVDYTRVPEVESKRVGTSTTREYVEYPSSEETTPKRIASSNTVEYVEYASSEESTPSRVVSSSTRKYIQHANTGDYNPERIEIPLDSDELYGSESQQKPQETKFEMMHAVE